MMQLEVIGITKSFGDTKAVDGISFSAPAGCVYGLVGRNGAGKTTTIRTIMDIYIPDSGEILIDGKRRDEDFHCRAGYLPEERGLYKSMSVMDNLLFLAEIKGLRPSQVRARAKQYLERFDLAKLANAKLDSLSKGNQQKVQFIGTILHDPELVILDEPFSGLDPVNSNLLRDMVLDLKKAGKLVILSTHMMDTAERLCDYVGLVDKGKLVLNAPPAEIMAAHSQCNISLQLEGDASFIGKLPYVESVQRHGNSTKVQVSAESQIQELLRTIVERRVVVKNFQSSAVSLHDVFVSLTQTEEEAQLQNAFAQEQALEVTP